MAPAIRTRHEILLGPARSDLLGTEPHMAATANPPLNSNDHVMAFLLRQPLIAVTGAFLHRLSQLAAVGFQLGQFLSEILFASVQVHTLSVRQLFYFLATLSGGGNLFLCQLRLFHQFE